jgi:hypothetical protein
MTCGNFHIKQHWGTRQDHNVCQRVARNQYTSLRPIGHCLCPKCAIKPSCVPICDCSSAPHCRALVLKWVVTVWVNCLVSGLRSLQKRGMSSLLWWDASLLDPQCRMYGVSQVGGPSASRSIGNPAFCCVGRTDAPPPDQQSLFLQRLHE